MDLSFPSFPLVTELGSVTHPSPKLCFESVADTVRVRVRGRFDARGRVALALQGIGPAIHGGGAQLRRWVRDGVQLRHEAARVGVRGGARMRSSGPSTAPLVTKLNFVMPCLRSCTSQPSEGRTGCGVLWRPRARCLAESVSSGHGCEVQLRSQVRSQVQLGNEGPGEGGARECKGAAASGCDRTALRSGRTRSTV